MGEVLSKGSPVSAAAVCLAGPVSPVEQVTDGEGEFWLEALPKGGYAVEVDPADHVIEIPALNLAD
ncbi:MAG TPA: carboxypeptidase-like regulatory domain-containing protein [Chloroflexota bacterium]|nr:carboxypeptidase-like regulatory domain-containing protein [Chloroflexota bacterium]